MSLAVRAFSILVVATAVVGGCGGPTAGKPIPGGTSTAVADSSPSSRPARPRELRLDGKDPCALVPESDWPFFYIEEPGDHKVNEPLNAPECFYDNNVGTFTITLVVTEGVEAWLDRKRRGQPGDIAPVAGFPAITVKLPNPDFNFRCDVAVDVAHKQYLMAAASIDDRKLSEVPEPCEYAHQLAESAMKTLVGP